MWGLYVNYNVSIVEHMYSVACMFVEGEYASNVICMYMRVCVNTVDCSGWYKAYMLT